MNDRLVSRTAWLRGSLAAALLLMTAPSPSLAEAPLLMEAPEAIEVDDFDSLVEASESEEADGPETIFRWSSQKDEPEEEGEEEEDEIVTDRPDFTEASSTVGKGRFQIETGYTYTQDRSDGATFHAHSYPETLLRIGLFAEWFELRIAQNYLNERTADQFAGTTVSPGLDDTYLGLKLGLTEQAGILPEMALMPQMTVPTGHDDFTSNQVLPGANFLFGWDVNDFLSWGGSIQGNRTYDETGEYYLEIAQSFTVNYALSKKLGAYTEAFWFMPSGSNDPDVSPQYYADGGFTYKLNRNLQLDIRAGVGLNEAADDFFAGAGVSYRMGKNTRDDIARPGIRVRR